MCGKHPASLWETVHFSRQQRENPLICRETSAVERSRLFFPQQPLSPALFRHRTQHLWKTPLFALCGRRVGKFFRRNRIPKNNRAPKNFSTEVHAVPAWIRQGAKGKLSSKNPAFSRAYLFPSHSIRTRIFAVAASRHSFVEYRNQWKRFSMRLFSST